MTPVEKIDNVLAQKYNLNMIKYNMGIDNYKTFLEILGYEGFSLINQAADLKKKQELLHVVSDVKSSELSAITQETKRMALENIYERGENTENERN